MDYIILKYIHFIGIFLVVGGVFSEMFLMKKRMSRDEIKKLSIVDGIYGAGAVLAVGAGLVLWLSDIGKPAIFYSDNGLVYWKLGVFGIVGIISIIPTVFFGKNKVSKKNSDGEEMVEMPSSIKRLVQLEFLLLLILPLLGLLMANGLSF